MSKTVPRYEFRIFARQLDKIRRHLQALATPESTSESKEIYLLDCFIAPDNNIKIRDGKLELKQLIECRQGLERWQPAGQWSFPVSPDTIYRLWPGDILKQTPLHSAGLSCNALLQLVAENSFLRYVNVYKKRSHFTVNGCATEMDRLLVDGTALESFAIESEHPQTLLEVLAEMQLTDETNCSYPKLLCANTDNSLLVQNHHGY